MKRKGGTNAYVICLLVLFVLACRNPKSAEKIEAERQDSVLHVEEELLRSEIQQDETKEVIILDTLQKRLEEEAVLWREE